MRVHTPYPSRKALMQVGLAGPIAGMAVIIPTMIVGLFLSHPESARTTTNVIRFGEPWLLSQWRHLIIGPKPVYLHPMAVGAWIGMLFTMVNLIPYKQFDGGHVVRGAFGSTVHKIVSVVMYLVAVYLAFRSLTWALVAIVMSLDWHYIDRPNQNDTPMFRWFYVLAAGFLFAMCWNQVEISR
jgi:membrane-associated protease RseP (regulator of RpoE activity)